jgi:outer membrane protein OmpA-like peptidoglycan-associated protein
MKKIIITSLSLLMMVSVFAQENENNSEDSLKKYNSLYVQLAGGLQQFYGDVHNDIYFPGSGKEGSISWYGNAKVGYNFNQYWGLRAQVSYGNLYSEYKDKSSYFDATTLDYGLELVMNVTNLFAPKVYNKKWNVYFAVGAGLLSYNSINIDQNDSILGSVAYDAAGNKDGFELARSFTFGRGVSYRVSDRFDIGLELAMFKPGIDDLDAKPRTLSELDMYSHVGLNITYTFGKNDDAWKWNPYEPQLAALLEEVEEHDKRISKLEDDVAELQNCVCEPKDQPDDDGDGVPNAKDLEPNTPKDALVNFQGVTIPIGDTTAQGGGAYGFGSGNKPMHFNSVFFAVDKSYISQESYKEIVKVAMFMKENPKAKVIISGNTDITASDSYNDKLSGRRTKAAYDILVDDFGIDANRLSRENLGETNPFSKKHFINRRVDFFLTR